VLTKIWVLENLQSNRPSKNCTWLRSSSIWLFSFFYIPWGKWVSLLNFKGINSKSNGSKTFRTFCNILLNMFFNGKQLRILRYTMLQKFFINFGCVWKLRCLLFSGEALRYVATSGTNPWTAKLDQIYLNFGGLDR